VWGRKPPPPKLPSASLPAVVNRLQEKPSASSPAVPSRLQDKPSASKSGGVGAVAPTWQATRCPRHRSVCKTSRAQQKAGCGGGSPQLPSTLLLAVAIRLQDEPSAAESERKAGVWGRLPPPAKSFVARGSEPFARQRRVGAAAPTCQALRCSR
jgi:hypothetical protein